MKWNAEQFLTGAGMMLAATVLLPVLKAVAVPVIVTTATGAQVVGSEVRKKLSFAREEFEDFIAEVQFERLKHHIDRDIQHGVDGR